MKAKYFIKIGNLPEQEVDLKTFIETEKSCGFYAKNSGDVGPATGGFGCGNIRGIVKYEN